MKKLHFRALPPPAETGKFHTAPRNRAISANKNFQSYSKLFRIAAAINFFSFGFLSGRCRFRPVRPAVNERLRVFPIRDRFFDEATAGHRNGPGRNSQFCPEFRIVHFGPEGLCHAPIETPSDHLRRLVWSRRFLTGFRVPQEPAPLIHYRHVTDPQEFRHFHVAQLLPKTIGAAPINVVSFHPARFHRNGQKNQTGIPAARRLPASHRSRREKIPGWFLAPGRGPLISIAFFAFEIN